MDEPYVWILKANKTGGEEYYEYVLVHVYDILCNAHDPHLPMKEISSQFRFNTYKVAPP